MADSAIASFPFIKTFSAISSLHCDYAVRTHGCTECTADALLFCGHYCRIVALSVDLVLCNGKYVLWTGINTEAAAFADIFIEGNFCHYSPLVKNSLLQCKGNHPLPCNSFLSC